MSICRICKVDKPYAEFHRDKGTSSGYSSKCKACSKEYQTTMPGFATVTLSHMASSSKKRGHKKPSFSRDDLAKWMQAQKDWDRLYSEWVASGYDKDLRPSCDRLDDKKHYTFDNLHLVTWAENRLMQAEAIRSGYIGRGKRVICVTTGEEFRTISEASRVMNCQQAGITRVCQGKIKLTQGLEFKYVKD